MGKTLIIAEKPSVATDLSRALSSVLGKFEKQGSGRDSYFENDDAIITSAVGHLVELRMPTGPNGKKLPWKFDVLPAIPDTFELDPIEDSEARLRQVVKLAKRKDVDHIINACDAGREGELIFRYIMQIGKIDKPIQRLWMQSMTKESILNAWKSLRSDEDMQPLADAAKCRSESDWLIGLNATRALTCFRSRHGGFNITSAGRVQTPTLAILATREAEIQAFKAEPFSEVIATFGVTAGLYEGKWIDEARKKDPAQPHGRAERIWDPAQAEAIRARCEGKTGKIEQETKTQTQIAPQLYDLTTLQREAPFSAKNTLSIAQALYEKHKMITYPRTDSRYLPEDYAGTVRETLADIANEGMPFSDYASAILAGKSENGPKFHQSRRVFDSKKVSDHFAIIPTGKFAKLSETEQKVYDMIVKRFLAVFYPAAEYEATKRLTRISHSDVTDTFRTEGRVLTKPGWLEVYGRRPGVASGKDELVSATNGDSAKVDEIRVDALETKPPARYTESTLLSAMEGAGKLVDDEALAEAMSERGLGTPATRAAIIEGLIAQQYIARDGRDLHVTPKGMRLIELIREMKIEGLASPSMTGDWEFKLRQMEHGKLSRDEFMNGIVVYTREIVEHAREHLDTLKGKEFPDIKAPCPKCGAPTLKQTDGTYECREVGCGFKAKKYIATRELSESEAQELFTKGFVGPLAGFKSKFNKPFDAALKLDDKFKVNFVFDQDGPEEAVELTDDQRIGMANLADGREVGVYQTDKAFIVPDIKTKNNPEGLRLGRTILQKEIPSDQALKLIATGKSDLIKGFVSKRTRKPFDAHLTLEVQDGKLGFEFPERPARAKVAKKDAE